MQTMREKKNQSMSKNTIYRCLSVIVSNHKKKIQLLKNILYIYVYKNVITSTYHKNPELPNFSQIVSTLVNY